MNITASIEISLRNTVCENLGHYFSVPNWLQQPPIHFQWREPEKTKITQALDSAQRAEYSKMTQAQKSALDGLAYPNGRPPNTSHLKRAKDRRKRIIVSEGKVIAELTLYFWKRLYGPDYDQTLWRTTLKKTFPYKRLTRSDVAIHLEKIYQARNRIAHHEPVLHKRFDDTMEAIDFFIRHLDAAPPSPNTPLANLLSADIHELKSKARVLHDSLASFRVGAA